MVLQEQDHYPLSQEMFRNEDKKLILTSTPEHSWSQGMAIHLLLPLFPPTAVSDKQTKLKEDPSVSRPSTCLGLLRHQTANLFSFMLLLKLLLISSTKYIEVTQIPSSALLAIPRCPSRTTCTPSAPVSPAKHLPFRQPHPSFTRRNPSSFSS